jgi:hypothetical protein
MNQGESERRGGIHGALASGPFRGQTGAGEHSGRGREPDMHISITIKVAGADYAESGVEI